METSAHTHAITMDHPWAIYGSRSANDFARALKRDPCKVFEFWLLFKHHMEAQGVHVSNASIDEFIDGPIHITHTRADCFRILHEFNKISDIRYGILFGYI